MTADDGARTRQPGSEAEWAHRTLKGVDVLVRMAEQLIVEMATAVATGDSEAVPGIVLELWDAEEAMRAAQTRTANAIGDMATKLMFAASTAPLVEKTQPVDQ